jgi:dihydrofolate reductase/thymidylate synthase
MSSKMFNIIMAHSFPEYGIGLNGRLPWNLKGDLQRFKHLTTSINNSEVNKEQFVFNTVIMGRKTYESLPESVKPLPGRMNIVITNQEQLYNDIHIGSYLNKDDIDTNIIKNVWFMSFEKLKAFIQTIYNSTQYYINENFIIGGAEIYKYTFSYLPINKVYMTEVYMNEKKNMDSFDTYIDKYDPSNWVINKGLENEYKLGIETVSAFQYDEKSNMYYRYIDYYSTNTLASNISKNIYISPENQYLKIMRDIYGNGINRSDRTGTGTRSLFGTQQKYDISECFPISTTKRIFFRAVFEELMLYLSGKTDNGILQEKGIHIWDGNTSREFLDNRGLQHYPEGDMGETYGFNFRHFGGEYKDCKTEYPQDGSNGYDQIANVIHLIKNDPTSRRILINLWNPHTLHKASLPSCLMMYQFYVDTENKKLHCQIYLRSSDYFLANNWNACTGAILTHLLCNLEGIDLTPGELTVVTGDTHLYLTHMEQVEQNLERLPRPAPKLIIKGEKRKDITDFKFEDLRLVGYNPYPNIKAPMAV